jgi:hypothetical protein
MCDCCRNLNDRLRQEGRYAAVVNLVLADGTTHKDGRLMVLTYAGPYPSKENPEGLYALFCPMCGEKYPEAKIMNTKQ